jgi:two-component system, chemotaxis family, CheB/CheR fusion protein
LKLVEINLPFHQVPEKEHTEDSHSLYQEGMLKQMLSYLKIKKNVDFSQYKKTTITRRIARRMALNKIKDVDEYFEFLKKYKNEQEHLFNDFLISVTQFFRDPASFTALTKKVLPVFLKEQSARNPIRIWIAGCATGQEAYSMAIIVQEFIKIKDAGRKIQIFATDISPSAIAKARNGIYDRTEIEGLSDERIGRHFTRRDDSYQVNKEIRDMCIFANHNLLQDPPFARMDLISCRNVLIYMNPVLQKRTFATFHYSLNENGFLLLGKSESPGTNPAFKFINGFEPEVKLYFKKGLSQSVFPIATRRMEENLQVSNKRTVSKNNMSDFQKTADELILSKYSPPGVIINEQFDIVQFRGSTGRWLEPAPGRASLNLLKMAKEGLSFELRNILHKVKQENIPAVKEDLNFVSGSKKEQVTIEAMAIPGEESYFLVLFHPGNSNGTTTVHSTEPAEKTNGTGNQRSVAELRIAQLEQELSLAREDMRSITEEQEASNEELQSANEELLSTTEELQTLNEELQTSNEEVQSTNEELQTLNQELIDRNNQLNLNNQYIEAIIDTIRDPIIILDRDLRVRTASKGFYQRFRPTESSMEGHLFYELKSCPWVNKELIERLKEVTRNKKGFIDYEFTCDIPSAGERTYSMNAVEFQRTSGDPLILISMEDITNNRSEQIFLLDKKEQLEERIKLAIDATGIGTWDFDPVQNTARYDDQSKILFGFSGDAEFTYSDFLECLSPADRVRREEILSRALAGENNGRYETQYRITTKNENKRRWISSRGKVFFDAGGKAVRLIGTMLDITMEKDHEELVKEKLEKLVQERTSSLLDANNQLEASNQSLSEFAYVASHDLQEPLRKINTYSQQLKERTYGEETTEVNAHLNKISEASKRMSRLIEDLLNYARLQNSESVMVPTDLKKIAESVVQDFDLQIIQSHASIEIGHLPTIMAIPLRMNQLFHNLLSNALKFMPRERQPVISIQSSLLSETEKKKFDSLNQQFNYHRIIFKDNGIGFNPEFSEKIFVIFQRLNGRSEYEGTGIGLTICRKIVLNHYGIIFANSKEDEGSEFNIILPEAS